MSDHRLKRLLYPCNNMFPNSSYLLRRTLKGLLASPKSPFKIIWKGTLNGKKLALTFDDGPDPNHTPRILDVLSELGLVATFFLLGYRAEKHANIVKEIVDRGHEIGNHSFDHNRFEAKPIHDFHFQIDKTNQLLESLVGISPRIFRPPYGSLSVPLLLYCMRKQIIIVMWSIDCMDSFGDDFKAGSNGLEYAKKNDIALMHDDCGISRDILQNEIPLLIDKGFSFVTVSSMLEATGKIPKNMTN